MLRSGDRRRSHRVSAGASESSKQVVRSCGEERLIIWPSFTVQPVFFCFFLLQMAPTEFSLKDVVEIRMTSIEVGGSDTKFAAAAR